MAYPTTPRLDNLAAMQSRPLGTNTALYRDPTTEALTRQYRQQKSDYGMARRLLRREARRGNADSAMKLIGLGKDASKEGVQFGMEGRDQMGAAVARQRSTMEKGATGMGLAAGRLRDATAPASTASAAPAAPASTASPAANMPPNTELGIQAANAMRINGGDDEGFRQGLARAIGMAKTPEEVDELRGVALKSGISSQQFDRVKSKEGTALQRLIRTGSTRK
jgi:hypothetical protein